MTITQSDFLCYQTNKKSVSLISFGGFEVGRVYYLCLDYDGRNNGRYKAIRQYYNKKNQEFTTIFKKY